MTLNQEFHGVAHSGSAKLSPPETPLSRRHGAPAGPWPWMNFDHISQESPPDDATPPAGWEGYPQSLFPNWGPVQVDRSNIGRAVRFRGQKCVIRGVDVGDKPPFTLCDDDVIESGEEKRLWEEHKPSARADGVRVRALFLDQPTGPVLQIIGTKYKIEPFFFSSALHRIPSRYQEEDREGSGSGDHITVTLPFVRIIKQGQPSSHVRSGDNIAQSTSQTVPKGALLLTGKNSYLVQELLAIHMVRSYHGSTIISFHPETPRNTAAKHLQYRIFDAGRSVYWRNILENTKDPTFLLLVYFWYALYAWDEALEELYQYISGLEMRTIEISNTSSNTSSAEILHNAHAHLLSYTSLLKDFEKSVRFVLKTPNPVRDERLRYQENERMEKECENLLSEIDRLETGRQTHARRLKNAMALLFSNVNINGSQQMQKLTSIAVQDSRAMKQVSLLTMVFLPASFAASLFGMNLRNFDSDPAIKGTLAHYLEVAIPLTAFTIWIILASQKKPPGNDSVEEGWSKLAWPIYVLKDVRDSISSWHMARRSGPKFSGNESRSGPQA